MHLFIEPLVFISGVFLFHSIVGELVLRMFNSALVGWRRLSLATVLGIAFFILISFIFSFLSLRWIIFPLLWLVSGASIFLLRVTAYKIHARELLLHILLVVMSIVYSLSVTTSGWITDAGITFRGVNGSDGIWNVALANEIRSHTHPEHVSASGIPLQGYHILYNMYIALVSTGLGISTFSLHYQYVALLLSVLLVYGVFDVSQRISGSTVGGLLGAFFALFGGSFGFIMPLVFQRPGSLDDVFGITQPASLLVSPSFALSLVFLVYLCICLDELQKNKQHILGIVVGLIAGVSIGVKVYAGMLAIAGLAMVSGLVRRFYYLVGVVIAILVAIFVFLPTNASYGFLLYQPLWPPHRVMQGELSFTEWELKRQTLEQMGSVLGLIKLEVIAFVIFFFGNVGTRVFGFFGSAMVYKKWIEMDMVKFIGMMLLVSFIVPMFFIQPIGTFNMIQFFWYFLVFLGIFAGVGIYSWIKRYPRWLSYGLLLLIIVLTLPSAYEKVSGAIEPVGLSYSASELQLYSELSRLGTYDDTVLEIPLLDLYDNLHIHKWFDSSGPPKITAFGNKQTYIGKEVVQFPYEVWSEQRLQDLVTIMKPQHSVNRATLEEMNALSRIRELYATEHIRYIVTQVKDPWFEGVKQVSKRYTNEYGSIYEVLPL